MRSTALLALILLVLYCSNEASGLRSLNVKVTAPWPRHADSENLESLEHIARSNESEFWSHITSKPSNDDDTSLLHKVITSSSYYTPLLEGYRLLASTSKLHTRVACPNNISTWAIVTNATNDCAIGIACVASDIPKLLISSTDYDDSSDSTCAAVAETDTHAVEFDKKFMTKGLSSPHSIRIILYADVLSHKDDFLSFHNEILKTNAFIEYYIIRHYKESSNVTSSLLGGFGVALNVKNTEYKMNDLQNDGDSSTTTTNEEGKELGERLTDFVYSIMHLKTASDVKDKVEELKKSLDDKANYQYVKKRWALKNVGLQASVKILKSDDPIEAISDISCNFPSYAKSLVFARASEIPPSLKKEVRANQRILLEEFGMDSTGVFLNGVHVPFSLRDFNAFHILNLMTLEQDLVSSISTVSSEKVLRLASTKGSGQKQQQQRLDTLYSQSSNVILYLNDIASSTVAATARWSSSVKDLLKPAWNLIPLKKNMYDIVTVLQSPLTDEAMSVISSYLFFISRGAPIRLGLLFSPSTEEEKDVVNKLLSLPFEEVVPYLENVVSDTSTTSLYEKFIKHFKSSTKTSNIIVTSDDHIKLVADTGLLPSSYVFNGIVSEVGDLDFQSNIMRKLLTDQALYVDLVSSLDKKEIEKLDKEDDLVPALLRSLPTLSMYIPSLMGSSSESEDETTQFFDSTEVKLKYIISDTNTMSNTKQSLWILCDLSNKELLRTLVLDALLLSSKTTRVALIHDVSVTGSDIIGTSIMTSCLNGGVSSCIATIRDYIENDDSEIIPKSTGDDNSEMRDYASIVSQYLKNNNDTSPIVVVLNGRDITSSVVNQKKVLPIILDHEYNTTTRDIIKELNDDISDDTLFQVHLMLLRYKKSTTHRIDYQKLEASLENKHSLIRLNTKSKSKMTVTAIVDPVSTDTQRLSEFLKLFKTLNYRINIYLMPSTNLDIFPISRFYQFTLKSSSIDFDVKRLKGITVTVSLETPEGWVVQLSETNAADLDNINLDSSNDDNDNINVVYNLESILVTGSCVDVTASRLPPPNGLQLQLSNTAAAHVESSDTLVMQNLGYFQFRASVPGLWSLSIPSPTRASELYQIVDGDNQNPISKLPVVVTDFHTHVIKLRVSKKAGKESQSLLLVDDGKKESEATDDEQKSGIWSSVSSYFAPSVLENTGKNETIHVFSLATGALYERFLKVMMLSVIRATPYNPIVFWLLSNFLSPEFITHTIPSLQKEFGITIRLVTYKWPMWLRAQESKQRIIWGYKILFLDVLFPLNVKRIIYVDADQVVRSSLAELWEMDLKGCVYGYTPFCTSRNETLGFQFWRSGYWKDHLRGKPYHISALYVVDLALFRARATGDMLRAVYDQLSRDANSLSNLDQDLPNYTQHQIPIFSLPTDWLWCESWCDDASKKTSKTIDLCNNPLHKEPKLEMAKRVISGSDIFNQSWVELDAEISSAEKGGTTS